MISAIILLTLIGLLLGFGLAIVNYYLPATEDPLTDKVNELLPGTQCGQCGYAGCRQAATALVEGTAPLNLCPPGGPNLVDQLASTLGRDIESSPTAQRGPTLAWVNRDLCIGCTKCLRQCPTDALVGAAKQIHVVLDDACTGCGACTDVCEPNAIQMQEVPQTLSNWYWPKPDQVSCLEPVKEESL